MTYHPGKNSHYIPYVDHYTEMRSANPAGEQNHPAQYKTETTTCQGPPLPAGTEAAAPAPAGRGAAPGAAGAPAPGGAPAAGAAGGGGGGARGGAAGGQGGRGGGGA